MHADLQYLIAEVPIVTKKAAPLIVICLFLLWRPCLLHALDVGDPAKDFALTGSDGAIVTLHEARRGAPVTLIEFISVYCEACRKKAPYVNRLAETYGPRGLRILAVALANDRQETAVLVKDWKISYPVIPDPDKKTFYLYGIHKVPQLFIIDGAGIIRYKGNADAPKEIEKVIESLLGQNSGPRGGSLKPGDQAPAVRLADLRGEAVTVGRGATAAYTLLAFFSTSESDNRRLARTLCSLSGANAAGALIYGIVPGAMEKAGAKLAGLCPGLPLLVDRSGDAVAAYGVADPPEIIMLSRSGYVRMRNAPQAPAELSALLRPAVAASSTLDEAQLSRYLHDAIPGAFSIRPVRIGDGQTVYIGDSNQGKRLARVVKKDIMCEVCTDVYFIMTIDKNGLYKNITLINPFELSGKRIDAGPFVRQFIGRSFHQTLAAGNNADIITGATKSCEKFMEGLNETSSVLSSLRKSPFDAAFRQAVCFLNQGELEAALQRRQHEHPRTRAITLQDLGPLCPGGKVPQCPDGGTYRITVFNSVSRVLCTKHGLDPRSSMIH